ncbi:hypothetical protein M432DRAFT_642912 [Thermoascus aurantiacus ATCC 26904]
MASASGQGPSPALTRPGMAVSTVLFLSSGLHPLRLGANHRALPGREAIRAIQLDRQPRGASSCAGRRGLCAQGAFSTAFSGWTHRGIYGVQTGTPTSMSGERSSREHSIVHGCSPLAVGYPATS